MPATLLLGGGADAAGHAAWLLLALVLLAVLMAWRGARRRPADVVALHQALLAGELSVQLQPIMGPVAGSMQLAGFECLARWHRADGLAIPPSTFVPLAERAGLGRLLLLTVVATLMRDFGRTLREHAWLSVAVNLSAQDLGRPGLLEDLGRLLARAGVRPEQIVLEITEGAIEGDGHLVALDRARAAGHPLGIDDFGVGASNADRLLQLRPDLVKVDRCFVSGASGNAVVLRHLVAIARAHGARVVIEGIETPGDAACLQELGDVCGQGYLWSPALDPDAATRLVLAAGR